MIRWKVKKLVSWRDFGLSGDELFDELFHVNKKKVRREFRNKTDVVYFTKGKSNLVIEEYLKYFEFGNSDGFFYD